MISRRIIALLIIFRFFRQLEKIVKTVKKKEMKKEDQLKRKQEIYYSMLMKLETQCRTQYLNVLVKKFANFMAKLATTMPVPSELVEPYARMQRGIFCNILLAIGVKPKDQNSIYYNTPAAKEYEVLHKLSHALLSLIIKSLDAAAQMNPEDIKAPVNNDFEMDSYIKDRLMCAAEKKITNLKNRNANSVVPDLFAKIFPNCEKTPGARCCRNLFQ